MRRLPSFSQWDRALACQPSETLRHVRTPSPHAKRGSALHKFMEIYVSTNRDREAALAAIHEEFRAEAARIDVGNFAFPAEVATEVAVGLDLLRQEARTLDVAYRAYPDPASPWETHGTLDLIGRDGDHGDKDGMVVLDYKFGFAETESTDGMQLALGAASALALEPSAERAWVGIVRLVDGVMLKPYMRTEPYTRDSLRPVIERALTWAAKFRAGELSRTYEMGDHCRYCPAFRVCPAQVHLLRGGFAEDNDAITDLPAAYERVTRLDRALRVAKDQLREHALREPIPMGDGRVYGMVNGQVRAHRPREGGGE